MSVPRPLHASHTVLSTRGYITDAVVAAILSKTRGRITHAPMVAVLTSHTRPFCPSHFVRAGVCLLIGLSERHARVCMLIGLR